MSSIRNQILQKVADVIGGPGAPAGLLVSRSFAAAFTSRQMPAIAVTPLEEQVKTEGGWAGPSSERRLIVLVDVFHVAKTDELVEEKLDAVLNWVTASMLADFTLGGTATNVEEVWLGWEGLDADEQFGKVQMHFAVTYSTLRHNQEERA